MDHLGSSERNRAGLCRVFLATGWQVAVLDRDVERLSTFAAEKKNVIPIVTDVTDSASRGDHGRGLALGTER